MVTDETKLKRKERNPRLPKDEIDILDYKGLLIKVLNVLARKHGKNVFLYEEDLIQEGYIGLIKALEAYDPTRGTYVTIAYLKVYTEMTRFLLRAGREYRCTVSPEDLTFMDGSPGDWESLFQNETVDYDAVARLAAVDDIDLELYKHLVSGTRSRSIHVQIGITTKEVRSRKDRLKENMVAVTMDIYGDINGINRSVRG